MACTPVACSRGGQICRPWGGGNPSPPDRWLLGRYRAIPEPARVEQLFWFCERTRPLDRRRLAHLVAHAVGPHGGAQFDWIEASLPRAAAWRIAYPFWCSYMYEFDLEAGADGWRADRFETEEAVEVELEPADPPHRIGDVAVVCDRIEPDWIESVNRVDLREFVAAGLPIERSTGSSSSDRRAASCAAEPVAGCSAGPRPQGEWRAAAVQAQSAAPPAGTHPPRAARPR